MSSTSRLPSRARPPRLLPRRSFVQSLSAAPVLLGLRSLASEPAAAKGQPKSFGPRGQTFSAAGEIKELRDPETGARVVQLTGGDSDNVHLYFTSDSFLADSNRVVFGSNRSGRYQFYLLETREQRLTQLTEREGIRPTLACLSRHGRLNYFDGSELRVLHLDTLEDREVYRVPGGYAPRLATCTDDGGFVAFAYGEKTEVSTQTGAIYSTMAETYYQHPASVIMRINTKNGQALAVWGERMWISHVVIHPFEPDTIVFCHEGGGLVKQRMWVVNAAVRRARQAVPLFPMRPGEFTVHEYFTRTGDVGFQYEVERNGRMEYYNAFIRPDGTWIRQYLLPGPRPGHIQSNSDNTLVVGDRGFLSYEDKTGTNYVSLMTHGNGVARVRRLCRHQPGPTQYSHGHPVFSPDDRWVIYNSRLGPREHIAMADVTSL